MGRGETDAFDALDFTGFSKEISEIIRSIAVGVHCLPEVNNLFVALFR